MATEVDPVFEQIMRRLQLVGNPIYRREEETIMASKQGKYTYYTSVPRRILEYSKMAMQALDTWMDDRVTWQDLKDWWNIDLEKRVTFEDFLKWQDDPIIPYRKQAVSKHHFVFSDGTIVIVIEPSGKMPGGNLTGPGRSRT